MPSTRRNEESSSAPPEEGKESSLEKSKTESDGFLARVWLLKLVRVQSAIRPSLSEREKGANGTLSGRLRLRLVEEESGGPQPSGLNGTAPTSKPPTMVKTVVGCFFECDCEVKFSTSISFWV